MTGDNTAMLRYVLREGLACICTLYIDAAERKITSFHSSPGGYFENFCQVSIEPRKIERACKREM